MTKEELDNESSNSVQHLGNDDNIAEDSNKMNKTLSSAQLKSLISIEEAQKAEDES